MMMMMMTRSATVGGLGRSSCRRFSRKSSGPARPRIEIVLLKDFPQVGYRGETTAVKAGFARNHLIPQKIAAYATRQNVIKFALAPGDERLQEIARQRELDFAKRKISRITLKMRRNVDDGGDGLRKKITKTMISDELFKRFRIDLMDSQIVLASDGLTRFGTFNIAVNIDKQSSTSLKLVVEQQQQ